MAAEQANSEIDSDKKELYLVDGSGFIFRAYYAIAYGGGAALTNPAGLPVGAVYIFTNMLLKLLTDYHAPYLAVIFDATRKNFRNEIYPDYKANRDEPPEDLIPQFPLIREATQAFDLPCLEQEGYEADDLIAAYTRQARTQGIDVVIVSSDKDLMQLVGPGVRMLEPMKNKFITEEDVLEKFGVSPDKVVDVQALAGDSTDNVPGVPGVGVKTAAQLINEYGSLEELLNRAEEIKQPKRRETLLKHTEEARISAQLVKLDENAPMPVALKDLHTNDVKDNENLKTFLRTQGFNSILKRLSASVSSSSGESGSLNHEQRQEKEETFPPISENQYILINDEKTLQDWIEQAYEEGVLAIDTETTSLTPAKAELVGISIALRPGKAAYIPLGHKQAQNDLFAFSPDLPSAGKGKQDTVSKATDIAPGREDIKQLDLHKTLVTLKPLLEDESVLKVGHNMKYDWQLFKTHGGIETEPCDCTMLISYVLDGTSHSHAMDKLSEQYLHHRPVKYEAVAGKGKTQISFDHVPIEKALDYAAEDADITLRLHKILKPRLAREKVSRVYENIDRPLIPVIAQMELAGIKVDPQILKSLGNEFGKRILELEEEIYKLAQCEFNVGSPKQVGEILFGNMGLDGGRKTKTGQWQTDVSTLEKLAAEGHEIVQKILDWRALSKLKSTYTDALQDQINPKTDRVHTSFSMAHTSTGRLASSDPNMQNIPIRTEDGRKIRTAFIAEEGYSLLSVDYSQVELRLAAEIAGVQALKDAFKNGIDIHTLTASQVFGIPIEQVTSEIRRQAKAVNFGIIYGISGWGLAKQLGCTPAEAGEFIKRYLNRFSEIQQYMEAKKEEARTNGFVKTLYGRKCYIPNIKSKIPVQKSGAERAAINAPLQGTAADIMKIAMAAIPSAFKKAKLKATMLLQVHDELIFEVPDQELKETKQVVLDIMEHSYKLPSISIDVPLKAEAGFGPNWGQAH